jgi:hypothetical protein
MAYLGYKNKAFMAYKKEQERVKMWKAELKRKRLKLKRRKDCLITTSIMVMISTLVILFYAVVGMSLAKADGSKVGVGNFVMAVSYTESYNDLVYVSNFINCDHALKYYEDNCATQGAMIMMCQLEEYLYMPIGHNSDSSFDFAPTDKQSCGFVGVDTKFTGVK